MALASVVAAHASSSHLQVLMAAHPSCAPILNVVHYGNRFSPACRDLNTATFDRALRPDIKRVVLEARWAKSAGNMRLDSSGRPISVRNREAADGTVFSAALQATVERLAREGKKVVVLGPVPEQTTEITRALIRARFWNVPLPEAVTLRAFLERQAHVMAALDRLAKIPNVRVLYPHKLLCDAKICRFSADGQPFYSDSHHLTPRGAAELEPLMAEIFEETASR